MGNRSDLAISIRSLHRHSIQYSKYLSSYGWMPLTAGFDLRWSKQPSLQEHWKKDALLVMTGQCALHDNYRQVRSSLGLSRHILPKELRDDGPWHQCNGRTYGAWQLAMGTEYMIPMGPLLGGFEASWNWMVSLHVRCPSTCWRFFVSAMHNVWFCDIITQCKLRLRTNLLTLSCTCGRQPSVSRPT